MGKVETETMPMVVIEEEKGETHKTGYITLYAKLFKAMTQKGDGGKNRKAYP